MNVLKKIYCRTFQTCFKLAIPLLPYRDPKILNSIEELPAEFKKRKISTVMLVTDFQLRTLTRNLEELLPQNGIKCIVYDKTVQIQLFRMSKKLYRFIKKTTVKV